MYLDLIMLAKLPSSRSLMERILTRYHLPLDSTSSHCNIKHISLISGMLEGKGPLDLIGGTTFSRLMELSGLSIPLINFDSRIRRLNFTHFLGKKNLWVPLSLSSATSKTFLEALPLNK